MIQSTLVCLCIPIWLNLSKPLVHPTVTPLASLSKRPISPRALGKNSWLLQNWATATRYISGYTRNTWHGPLVQRQGQCWNRQRVRKGKDWRRCSKACVGTRKEQHRQKKEPPSIRFLVANRVHPSKWWKATVSIIYTWHVYIYIIYINYLSINCMSCKFLAAERHILQNVRVYFIFLASHNDTIGYDRNNWAANLCLDSEVVRHISIKIRFGIRCRSIPNLWMFYGNNMINHLLS